MTATRLAAWAALGLMVAGEAQAQQTPPTAVVQADPAAVTALANAIQQALAALPPTRRRRTSKPRSPFRYRSRVSRTRLSLRPEPGRQPVAQVRRSVMGYAQKVARGEGEAGTGALAQRQSLSTQSLGAGPSGGGGGTSDYSRRP